MPRTSVREVLGTEGLQQLQRWVQAHETSQQVALRCRIVLAAAAGASDVGIAEELKVNRHTAALWRARVCGKGAGAVWEVE